MTELVVRSVLIALFLAVCWLPAWWLAGRLEDSASRPFFRFLVAVGLALVGYLTGVNLLGRLLENSLQAVAVYLGAHALACAFLLRRRRSELAVAPLLASWKRWALPVGLAVVLGIPQWFQAVSSPRWDEIASSSIHVTAANQFAEGMFPPRHNAFPDIPIKYHYAFTLLSGTVRWLTGLHPTVSIDVASTLLWLFVFLFAFSWLRRLGLGGIPTLWGSFAVLLGGGLSWAYLPWLETYEGFNKVPDASLLVHRYDPEATWLGNLIEVMKVQNIHLRNADGTISSLPFDVAIHFQQHAVAAGIALSLVAAYLFWLWQTQAGFAPLLLILNVVCLGLVFLGHGAFGAVMSLSAGLVLAGRWLRRPGRLRVYQAVALTAGVTLLAFLHGGLLSRGEVYGSGDVLRLRDGLGYHHGGFLGFVNWTLAGFGLPLLFTALAAWAWWRDRRTESGERTLFLAYLGTVASVSFLIPQLFYFGAGPDAVEDLTEICKFFFVTHLAVALVSSLGVAHAWTRLRPWLIVPCFVATAITPLAVCWAGSLNPDGSWVGFYKSPYEFLPGLPHVAAGKALARLKSSNRDVYFAEEERTSGYLNELLIFGGSVFSSTPTRYEITGDAFLLSPRRVGERLRLDSRRRRLLPGSVEAAGCDWLYLRPRDDLAMKPVAVRSRFAKLVGEGYVVERFEDRSRTLYSIEKPTGDLDQGIERYWQPKVILQARSDWDGDGKNDLIFFNYRDGLIEAGGERLPLPASLAGELPLISIANRPGDRRVDLIVGRMADVFYAVGKRVEELIRLYRYYWTVYDSAGGWRDEEAYWFWTGPLDMPIVADLDGDGFDTRVSFRPAQGQWWAYPSTRLDGPTLGGKAVQVPFAGRFLAGSTGDLAVWSPTTGRLKVQSREGGKTASLDWGGQAGDVLVPGDYDGDGYDEIGIWQPHSTSWWVRRLPDGPNRGARFGSASSVPLPADYDGDGRVDLAYWEPAAGKIFVSFDFGQSVAVTIPVPPHSIPAFVNMY